ncbi:MAG: DUF5996 family protein [Chloroflexota bacterium]
MSLPKLDNFDSYIHQVHQAIFLFGAIAHQVIPKQQNWLHIATEPYPWGFQTQVFPTGGRLIFNVSAGNIQLQHGDGNTDIFALVDHTQKSLFEAILSAMDGHELVNYFDADSDLSHSEQLLSKIHSDDQKLTDAVAEHTHETSLAYDVNSANDYLHALNTIYTGIARWRGRLNGHLSPMVVWAEHFDLSTIWFATPEMDEYKSHINIGFAPFTEGVFERPYLYAYAYPYQEDYKTPNLDAPLKWETEAYTGIYVSYDNLTDYDDPVSAIEMLCGQIFKTMRTVLG